MNRQHSILFFGALFLPFLILYGLTTNQLFSFDAITNAIACETNESIRWFHPNHPLYPFLGVLWFKLERALGYDGYAVYSLARFNTLLMSSALGLLCLTIKKQSGSFNSIALTFFLGVTYAVWHYAVDGRAIGASVFFSVLLIVYLFHLQEFKDLNFTQLVIMGILSTAYVLVHGIGFFHAFPVLFWLWQNKRSPQQLFVYGLTFFGGLFLCYVLVYSYITSINSGSSFFQWALGYAGPHGNTNMTGGGFWGRSWLSIIEGLWVGWERSLLTVLPFKMGKILSSGLAGICLILFLTLFAGFKKIPTKHSKLAFLFILWGMVMFPFLAFWSPGQEGFRLHVLIPWTVALGILIGTRRLFSWLLLLMAVVLFYLNFSHWFFKASFIENNQGYQTLRAIRSLVKPGDVIVAAEPGSIPGIEVLLPYLFPELSGGTLSGRLMAFRETSLDPFTNHLIGKIQRGHTVYFSEDMFDDKIQQGIENRMALPEHSFRNLWLIFKPEEAIESVNGVTLVRMKLLQKPI
ncbi:MAG: hypothetical protein KCHDKBKB_00530 [Elusimicrobia bacterium]|nr:hypothetical protein [Elusimicrobiota bacterium]